MPEGLPPDGPDGEGPRDLTAWQRLLLRLPRARHDADKAPLGERFRDAVLKPIEPEQAEADARAKAASAERSVEELEDDVRFANDQERFIGLIAAPLAAVIGLIITSTLISDDPVATIHGRTNPQHVSVGLYHAGELVLLALALGMLLGAWYRKRMVVGIAMALYGLTVFNLHYWGFGIPFLLGGAWYLVRAYRAQQALKTAKAGGSVPRRGGGRGDPSGPQASKRYTPKAPPRKKPPASKPDDEKRAG